MTIRKLPAAASFAVMMAALASCAGSIQSVRDRGSVRAVVTNPDFDALIGCIGDQAAARYELNYTPSQAGGSFVSSYFGIGGRSTMLVDVARGTPATATIRITGGPWLGQDDDLIARVENCAG